jgi:hypothetical protein
MQQEEEFLIVLGRLIHLSNNLQDMCMVELVTLPTTLQHSFTFAHLIATSVG